MSFRVSRFAGASLLAAAALALLPTRADATVFGFAGSVGASNTFSVASGGNVATFSSSAGAGTFTVADAGFYSFGIGLGDYGSFSGDPLTITFATPVTQSVVIPFGLEDAFGLSGSDTLTATASNGQVVVAGTTLNNLSFSEPEGTLVLQPTSSISSITLTSSNPYAIANVQVPEPVSVLLLGTGLAALAITRRRSPSI